MARESGSIIPRKPSGELKEKSKKNTGAPDWVVNSVRRDSSRGRFNIMIPAAGFAALALGVLGYSYKKELQGYISDGPLGNLFSDTKRKTENVVCSNDHKDDLSCEEDQSSETSKIFSDALEAFPSDWKPLDTDQLEVLTSELQTAEIPTKYGTYELKYKLCRKKDRYIVQLFGVDNFLGEDEQVKYAPVGLKHKFSSEMIGKQKESIDYDIEGCHVLFREKKSEARIPIALNGFSVQRKQRKVGDLLQVGFILSFKTSQGVAHTSSLLVHDIPSS